MTKRCTVILLAFIFFVTASVAIAADTFVVIKDKNGICKVLKAKGKTPETIAGPFSSKEEATKAKEKECPKAVQPKKPGKPMQ